MYYGNFQRRGRVWLSARSVSGYLLIREDKVPRSPSHFLVLFPDLLKKISWELLNPSLNLIQTLPIHWISAPFQPSVGFELLPSEHGPDSFSSVVQYPSLPYLRGHTHKVGRRSWGSREHEVWVIRWRHTKDSTSSLEKHSVLRSPWRLGQFGASCCWKHQYSLNLSRVTTCMAACTDIIGWGRLNDLGTCIH